MATPADDTCCVLQLWLCCSELLRQEHKGVVRQQPSCKWDQLLGGTKDLHMSGRLHDGLLISCNAGFLLSLCMRSASAMPQVGH